MKRTALATCLLLTVAACSSTSTTPASNTITVTNCGAQVEFPAPAKRLFVNDGNMISMALALKTQDTVAAVSSLQRDEATLRSHYGDAVDSLKSVSDQYPSRETVLAQSPDVMVAGWNYGYSEEKNLTPTSLRQSGIAAYTLSESCRQADGKPARGTIEPWEALRTDVRNLGDITGHKTEATSVVADLDSRLDALRGAPKAAKTPVIFLFDSASDTVFSSGKFGAPQAIIDAAGGVNALSDLDDTWTSVSWERVAAANPDAFVFVDYPPQTYEQKVALLKGRAGINQLPAVTENRFLSLPYALWTSGPLNIDAAEQMRKKLEQWNLVPSSSVTAKYDDESPKP